MSTTYGISHPKHLPGWLRFNIYDAWCNGKDGDIIYAEMFARNKLITRASLGNLLRMFGDPKRSAATTAYLMCRRSKYIRTGASRKLMSVDLDRLLAIIELKKSRRLRHTVAMFHDQVRDDVSPSLIYRRMREKIENGGLGLTRKKLTRINVNADINQVLEYLGRVAHVKASRFINIDGMVNSAKDFRDQYGWSPPGRDCNYDQVKGFSNIFHCRLAVFLNFLMAPPSCVRRSTSGLSRTRSCAPPTNAASSPSRSTPRATRSTALLSRPSSATRWPPW